MTDVANIQAQQNVITNTLQAQTEQQANYLASVNTYNTDIAQMVVNQQNAQAATNQAAIAAQAGVYKAALDNQAQVYIANTAAQANVAQAQAQVNIANQVAQANIEQSQAQVYVANQQAQEKVGTAYNQAQANIATSAYNAASNIGVAAQTLQYVPAAPNYLGGGSDGESWQMQQLTNNRIVHLAHAFMM
jgi:paraquat-inducible protein B